MEFSAEQISVFLQGTVEGNLEEKVNDLVKIEEGEKGKLSFLANPKYEKYIYTTKSSIVLINKDLKLEKKVEATLIRVEDAYRAFASLLNLYQQAKTASKTGIEQPSFVSKNIKINEDVYIGAFVYIAENVKIGKNVKIFPHVYIAENVEIADNTILYAGVKIYDNSKIGKDCIIHAGAVIGSDGFGFAPNKDKTYNKIAQVGNVIIEDNVEIGGNTTIDRATIGSTIIRKGVKIDNLVQIAHNAEIGENTVIAALTAIAGSTKLGKNCVLAGQVGIVGHIKIADNTTIAAQSGISSSIKKENQTVLGSPAFQIMDYKRSFIVFKQLPELRKKILELERNQKKDKH